MKRAVGLGFSVLSYLIFFGSFLYLVGFVTGYFVPKTVGAGPALFDAGRVGVAVVANLSLVALFGIQHSIMARGWFKRAAARVVEPRLFRSVFVLAAAGVLLAMFALWQPMPTVLWAASGGGATALAVGELAGWAMVLVSTFLIDHFELFGLRQGWAYFRERAFEPPPMKMPGFYRFVRHPIYLGFLVAFWCAPTMTAGRLLFAGGMSAYILVGIRFEERDLLRSFGETYQRYRERVGMLIPRPGRGTSSETTAQDRGEGRAA